jgi:hypothetical protein
MVFSIKIKAQVDDEVVDGRACSLLRQQKRLNHFLKAKAADICLQMDRPPYLSTPTHYNKVLSLASTTHISLVEALTTAIMALSLPTWFRQFLFPFHSHDWPNSLKPPNTTDTFSSTTNSTSTGIKSANLKVEAICFCEMHEQTKQTKTQNVTV